MAHERCLVATADRALHLVTMSKGAATPGSGRVKLTTAVRFRLAEAHDENGGGIVSCGFLFPTSAADAGAQSPSQPASGSERATGLAAMTNSGSFNTNNSLSDSVNLGNPRGGSSTSLRAAWAFTADMSCMKIWDLERQTAIRSIVVSGPEAGPGLAAGQEQVPQTTSKVALWDAASNPNGITAATPLCAVAPTPVEGGFGVGSLTFAGRALTLANGNSGAGNSGASAAGTSGSQSHHSASSTGANQSPRDTLVTSHVNGYVRLWNCFPVLPSAGLPGGFPAQPLLAVQVLPAWACLLQSIGTLKSSGKPASISLPSGSATKRLSAGEQWAWGFGTAQQLAHLGLESSGAARQQLADFLGSQEHVRAHHPAAGPRGGAAAAGGAAEHTSQPQGGTSAATSTAGEGGTAIASLALSFDGSLLATCGLDHVVKVWNFGTLLYFKSLSMSHLSHMSQSQTGLANASTPGSATASAVDGNSQLAGAGAGAADLSVVEDPLASSFVRSLTHLHFRVVPGAPAPRFSNDNSFVVAVSTNGTGPAAGCELFCWEHVSGTLVSRIAAPGIAALEWRLPFVVTGHKQGVLRLWE